MMVAPRDSALVGILIIGASPDISLEPLLENPKEEPPELKLPSDYQIECLQGLHRVEAGKRILPPGG